MMDARTIHATLGADGWLIVLRAAGIPENQLQNKHGPCPICGGTDRYRFDNKHGRGDFYCNQCGAGDGFKLIAGTQGLSFSDARKLVMELGRLDESHYTIVRQAPVHEQQEPARATRRVLQLIRESCQVEDCEAVRAYLASRALWPLPQGHSLRAHPSVEYWHDRRCVGRYSALLAAVRDGFGEVVTVHVTYIEPCGQKIQDFEARKILSAMTGREGCAVRLMPHGSTLGIAEGIETALSASVMHELPVWAALNTSLLQKFQPPKSVQKLVIFADRDIAGLDAATKLMQRLQGSVQMEIRTPQSKDWNDAHRSAA
jgi:putative DNA primase/helicase